MQNVQLDVAQFGFEAGLGATEALFEFSYRKLENITKVHTSASLTFKRPSIRPNRIKL